MPVKAFVTFEESKSLENSVALSKTNSIFFSLPQRGFEAGGERREHLVFRQENREVQAEVQKEEKRKGGTREPGDGQQELPFQRVTAKQPAAKVDFHLGRPKFDRS